LCKGFEEAKEWTIKEWMDSQDVGTYNKESESYMQLTLHKHLQEKKDFPESKAQVFFKTCYDLDGFRKLIFESTFFDRFEVTGDIKEQMKTNDEALLDFGITKWLPFALFREDTMVVRDDELERGAQALGWKMEEG
ncbi:MAG: hypothetical protein SVM79_04730, partial [Chloroflexota bacterium]|nr:hypothetical protein [Chloroflexota bacterium]